MKESEESKRYLRDLLCGDFINSFPVEFLEYLGYEMKNLYCDVCGSKIKPSIYIHHGIECIKNCYCFENREQNIFFICCKKTKKKNCKIKGIQLLAEKEFLSDVDKIYEQLKNEQNSNVDK